MSTRTPAGEPSERPDDGSVVSDEQWAELVRQAERGGADAPKEPSARARMVTARLRALDEEAAASGRRFGRKRKPAEPWQPDGWRTGPAWQEMNGRARKRRRLVGALGFAVVLGALVVAMRPSLLTDHLPGGGDAVDILPLPAETAPPTAAPADGSGTERPTTAQPFRGSPALRWADGAEGIEMPQAKAVGGMSRDEVEQALRTTRQFLVEANLDPATLRGEKPEEALDLLDPLQKGERKRLEQSLAEPGEERDPLVMFTRFDPDEIRLVGDVVKTRGRMTFEAGPTGSVEVRADYTFVYPLVRVGEDEVARTIVRRELTMALHDPEKFVATAGKLSVISAQQNVGNTACEVDDGFLHPSFPGDGPGPSPTGPDVDPYYRGEWQPDGECGTVTRT
ncbi:MULTISPECIES: hypothetical protein [unclassified Streptomyces]|uniref:hypothetical protein n=1 Tax=unclassified Streptomyces TaxID=2593676 RepID=UPI0011C8871B|nr:MULTISPECIES: hypothetical protein [unclassified Streptomyces]TXS17573.1 hypothetical protein EAO68_07295 [Streptomyces sp. wa22]WSQ78097.1 hypothetical protein OG725_13680 [Streptomyces sp. NBC_01213]WSR08440.1 hypothetical protein OG265_21665 [Streptomyces sp. NBC_01208]